MAPLDHAYESTYDAEGPIAPPLVNPHVSQRNSPCNSLAIASSATERPPASR